MMKAREIEKRLSVFGAFVDEREYSPGWKFSEWEMKGVPLRLEIGPKDIEKKQVTLVRRDTGRKESIAEKDIEKIVLAILETMQKEMLLKARKFLDASIDSAKTLKELKEKISEGKMVSIYLVDESDVEALVKEATGGATSRILEESEKEGICIQTGKKTKTVMLFAKAY